jgi:hypothetical protein
LRDCSAYTSLYDGVKIETLFQILLFSQASEMQYDFSLDAWQGREPLDSKARQYSTVHCVAKLGH